MAVPRGARALCALASALLLGAAAPGGTPPLPLLLRYDVETSGLAILSVEFRLTERSSDYVIESVIRSAGVFSLFSGFTLTSESRGVLAQGEPHPSFHETLSHSRRGDRRSEIDYYDGDVSARVSPPDRTPAALTPDAIRGTLDPLTAVLALSRAVARAQRCAGIAAPVFDGRRRYDLVLSEPGAGPAPVANGRRCDFERVIIAEPNERGKQRRNERGEVWFAQPRPGAEPLPVRVEVDSDWGHITLQMIDRTG